MSNIPAELKYTIEHEWTKIDGDTVIIGITDFAQSSLGDIVFAEMPEVGRELARNDAFGVVESIKSVSDLYSPLSGTVIEANEELSNSPELLNSSPYDSWMIKLKISKNDEIDELLSAEQYKTHLENN
ncbi:MAG: glycine cleavage system protein GcvH [Epsilonproteobacteria bacterium]|nr:MAG: glycine cleavage system protein GcvH [Campylobacterota bacterium]RLA63282.1 MAG: glycine cleavage system protein GcvH [Campylobacterota bacterium]